MCLKNDFVHLHVHTEYSLLDGANRIKELVKRTKELGMDSIAITDHGVMYGVIDFYKEAKKEGIKPVIGCEVYVAPNSRFDKQGSGMEKNMHLVLLAKNDIGYKNLMKIVSTGFLEGFYYKPRVDIETLEKYHEGIIALSACLAGIIARPILNNNMEKARETAIKFKNIFGKENFYLELQMNKIPEQNLVNQKLIEFSKELDLGIVATNDAHYLRRKDAKAHEVLLCIQTGKTMNDEDRMKFSSDDFYIKSTDEMKELFKNFPEAIENTRKIADMCNVEIEFGKLHLPKFEVPEQFTSFEYLKNLCETGLKRLYTSKQYKIVTERLDYELSIIERMGYVDYFLIVWDFIKYAKDNGIMVGPGRGSAAGSIVSYTLGITNIDPIKYDLLFERFLNPERVSMPDIDIDFCYERRQEVIDYVIKKYGEDKVAQIITFGTMAARSAIRDVGRALDMPYGDVDVIAKFIPTKIGMNLKLALEINPELKKKYDTEPASKELIDMAILLEGMPRHASTHAAGVVISKESITNYVPLQKNDESVTTQFVGGLLEEQGLLKMDFLGLRTLTVIRDAVSMIERNTGKKIDIERLPLDDENVYKFISEGRTSGIFQLESSGMTNFMRELQPKTLEDIIAGISLYRPGPMDQIPRYIENKNNSKNIKYVHPLLKDILEVTYGCMVYQEQVMRIVRELAGYSMGRSDLVRRAMSKKKVDVMEQERKNFINGIVDENGKRIVNGCVYNGVPADVANGIFDEMMDFASYAFNKSHAAAYAVVAYETAYLKYYYPVEFMAALLNSFVGSQEKISQYIYDCKLSGIEVLPPDVNESNVKFSTVKGRIRFGLQAIKNAGENAVSAIIREREVGGEYKNFDDFIKRVNGKDVNKKCIESLIKSGAFDSFGVYRSRLMAVYEKMIDSITQIKRKNFEGQLSLFELSNSDEIQRGEDIQCIYPNIEEFSKKELLSMEKEMLSLYLTGHPVDEFAAILSRNVSVYSKDIQNFGNSEDEISVEDVIDNEKNEKLSDGQMVIIGGIIANKKTKLTRNNNLMAFMNIEDIYGSTEVIIFPKILEKYSNLLIEENVVLVKGRLNIKEDESPKIICDEIRPLQEQQGLKKFVKLYLKIKQDMKKEEVDSLMSFIKYFIGETPVYLYREGQEKAEKLDKDNWIDLNDTVINELKLRLGEENVKLVTKFV